MRQAGGLKRHGRDQHKARRACPELIQQAMIRGGELGDACLAIKSLHLPELADHDARVHSVELGFPVAKVQVAPLFVNRVAFPGHAAEARCLFGEFVSQNGLQRTSLLLTHKIRLTCQNDDLAVRDLELAILERHERGWGAVGIAEAIHDVLRTRHESVGEFVDLDVAEGDHGFAVAVDLQGEVAFERNVRGALRVVHGADAIDEELDALVLGTDFVSVPFARLLSLGDQFLSGDRKHGLAA